jgi:hypothetical protein
MELKITLNEYADIPFIKKLLGQLKGVKQVETIDEEIISDNDYSKLLDGLLVKSIEQSKLGKEKQLTPDLLDRYFK